MQPGSLAARLCKLLSRGAACANAESGAATCTLQAESSSNASTASAGWTGLCLHLLITGKHVWHFAAVEQVVDVFNKGLILDLGVAEQEDGVLGLASSPAQDALQILPPLHFAIAFGNLHLAPATPIQWHPRQLGGIFG